MMETVRFRLGSDPELFLRDRQTKKLRSAIPIIKEGKQEPRRLGKQGFNAVLHDNVLIEFNTDPADDCDSFVKNIGAVLKKIDKIVHSNGVELHLQASAEFPLEELADEEARVFGCDPDYDAYRVAMNTIPTEAAQSLFRSAGGHLHIGTHEEDEELTELLNDPYGKLRVVKALDVFVGLPSVFLDKDPTAAARRSLYGKAGAHRPKEYGVEYRACSAWWLTSPKHTELVYRLSAAALSTALDEEQFEALIEAIGGEERLQEVINESQVDSARSIFEEHLRPLLAEDTAQLVDQTDMETAEFRSSWSL